MPGKRSIDSQLRSQIEAAAATEYSTEPIESRIAAALCRNGTFRGEIGADDLAAILRNVVYSLFSRYEFAGRQFRPLHNVASMKVDIRSSEAAISYLVHIHKPIAAFLTFRYVLVNDQLAVGRKIRLKRGSLRYMERTRRLDLKAKAALAAINIKSMAIDELRDVTQAIFKTLPDQLEKQSVRGNLQRIELSLDGERLNVFLEGCFEPAPEQERSSETQPTFGIPVSTGS